MSAEPEGRAAAEEFRRSHGLGIQPLGDLVTIVEQLTGIDVAVLDANHGEHGLAMRDPDRAVTYIAVTRSRHPMRQRSSLAHELGHVEFGDWTAKAVTSRSHEEVRADAFARHLLVPQGGVIAWLGVPGERQVGQAELSEAVERFLVSPAIAAIALEQSGHIEVATKEEWMRLTTRRLATQHGWSARYAALQDESDRVRAPRRLLARATRGYVEGVVSLETLASMQQRPAEAVLAELDDAGVRPKPLDDPWASPEALPRVDVDLSDLDDEAGER